MPKVDKSMQGLFKQKDLENKLKGSNSNNMKAFGKFMQDNNLSYAMQYIEATAKEEETTEDSGWDDDSTPTPDEPKQDVNESKPAHALFSFNESDQDERKDKNNLINALKTA